MDYFKNPLIPDKEAEYIIASGKWGNIRPPLLDSLDERIRHHSDITVCHLGGKRFVTAKNTFEYYVNVLHGAEVICGESEVKSPYPYEAAYCAAVFSRFAVANEKITDRVLLDILKSEFTFINVRQGYAKCSICPIADGAAITDDVGIYKKLSDYMDVLLIKKGFVRLKGYDSGFIGGAAGLTGPGKLLFCGSLEKSPDRERIYEFLSEHSVKAFEKEGELYDIGSVISIA